MKRRDRSTEKAVTSKRRRKLSSNQENRLVIDRLTSRLSSAEVQQPSTNISASPQNQHTVDPQSNLSCASTCMSVHSNTISSGGNVTLNASTINHFHGEKIDDGMSDEEVQKLAAWLSGLNYHATQIETYEKVTCGTGQWLIQNPVFEAWLEKKHGTLWGTGIPGAGKTHLMSIVVHHLQNLATSTNHCGPEAKPAAVIYAYCRYNLQLSVKQIIASLLRQLVEANEAVASYIKHELYDIGKKNFQATNLVSNTLPELLSVLKNATSMFSRTFILIDALDEIKDDVRYELVRTLNNLEQHLFLTSRNIPLEDVLTPDFEIRPPSRDFKLFISRELERFPKINSLLKGKPALFLEITEAIERKSDGMFLLSALQLAALQGVTSIKNLRQAINELPTTLADMYRLTLERIIHQSKEESCLALLTLLWITHAIRPMTIDELLVALSVDPNGVELDAEALTSESTLISACLGLLKVDRATRAVRLVHFTAQDFFDSYRFEVPGIQDSPHSHIAAVCTTYLHICRYGATEELEDQEVAVLANPETRPFCDYAVRNFTSHIAESLADADSPMGIPPGILRFFLGQRLLPVWAGASWSSQHQAEAGRLGYLAAFRGFTSWSNHLQTGFRFSALEGCTPLFYACTNGFTKLVACLLSVSEPDPDMLNFHVPAARSQTALCVASEKGYDIIVKHLLAAPGIDVNARDCNQQAPILIALRRGHTSVFNLLLTAHGIDVNAQDKQNWTPLHLASAAGWFSTVKQLLTAPGIQANVQGYDKRTPLHLALEHGHMPIVNLLLSTPGINANGQDIRKRTPLHLAFEHGHMPIVDLLLSTPGINANGQDIRKRTPLHLASRRGQLAGLVRLLATPYIDVNIKDGDAKTALIIAVTMRHPAIVQLLLDFPRTNVNAGDSAGWTALHYAARHNYLSTVEQLLNRRDTDVNAEDEAGWTPLHVACCIGNEQVVRLLLDDSSIDIGRRIVEDWSGGEYATGSTALDIATQNGDTKVIALFEEMEYTDIDWESDCDAGYSSDGSDTSSILI